MPVVTAPAVLRPALTRLSSIIGAYGFAEELSSGKDTPSGHWEIAGVPVLFDWGYFTAKENTFPPELLEKLIARGKLPGVLGNCHSSGTVIIAELGEEHVRPASRSSTPRRTAFFRSPATRNLLVWSVFTNCAISRVSLWTNTTSVALSRGRSSATDAAYFVRTGNRRDLTTPPHADTLLDKLTADGGEVISVGKISDIYAHQGITKKIKASGNDALFDATLEALRDAADRSIVFTNFVDFDMLYGHRRDVPGYAAALEHFDQRLPELLEQMRDDDILVICADHGCDPSWPGSDHTREHIPVLAYGAGIAAGPLGKRESFADIGQSLASFFKLSPMDYGTSFLSGGS